MIRTPEREKTLVGSGPATAGRAGRKNRATLAVLAFAALALLAGCGAGGGQDEGASPRGGSGGSEKAAKLGTPALGSADAPVVLTEYSDYQ